MSTLLQNALEKTALTLISAFLFVGFFQFNDLIFASFQ